MNRSVVDYKVMYVIPNDGVGGVEVAARTVRDGYYHNLNLKKLFITDTLKNKNDIRKYVDAFKEIMNFGPDLVISSLWRSQLVTVLYKIYRPKTRHVIFFHLPSNSSFVEKIVSSISMRFSDFIWVDSAATREGRVPIKYLNKTAVISYLVEYQRPIVGHSSNADFVFWGRLHKQKNIIRALIIFSQILVVSPKSKWASYQFLNL